MNKQKIDNKQSSLFSFFKRKNTIKTFEKEDEIVIEGETINNNTSILSKISNYIRNKSSSFLNKSKDTTISSNNLTKTNKSISVLSINDTNNLNKTKNQTQSASSILNNDLNHARLDNDDDDDPANSQNIYNKSSEPCRPPIAIIKKAEPSSRFTQSMYDKYPWIEYSLSKKKVFCFNCRMFGFESMEAAWVNFFIKEVRLMRL